MTRKLKRKKSRDEYSDRKLRNERRVCIRKYIVIDVVNSISEQTVLIQTAEQLVTDLLIVGIGFGCRFYTHTSLV